MKRGRCTCTGRQHSDWSSGAPSIRPVFDGLFIEEKIDGALGGVRTAENGTWDEGARHLELKGAYLLGADTWTQRTVIEPTSPNTMVVASYLSFGKVPEWKAVEIRYSRRPK